MEGGNSEKELRSVSSFVLDISAKAITSPRFDRGELNEKEKNGRGGGGEESRRGSENRKKGNTGKRKYVLESNRSTERQLLRQRRPDIILINLREN